MRRLLREPLLHFLLGGALLFAVYSGMAGPEMGLPDRIVVSEERVATLARTFERTWLRSPTEAELSGLVDEYVTEEVLYREALALGLDRDDLVVRRRMRQKMEFLHEDLDPAEPGEAELRAFLEAHPERFAVPPRVSFEQVFLRAQEDGAGTERAATVLARLRAGGDPEALGDATFLPPGLDDVDPAEMAGTFGPAFAEALAELAPGAWTGTVDSAFGTHLVRVTERRPGRVPTLEEVRPAVEREWAARWRAEAQSRFHDEVRARYRVEIRMPSTPAAPDVASRP